MDEGVTEADRIRKEAELAAYEGPDRVVSSMEFAEIMKLRPVLPKHLTGIPALDQAIDGFEPGELIVISGPTAMGKTLLCDSIMTNLRKESKFSLFFTFEVTPEKVIQNHKEPGSVIFLPLQHKPSDLTWIKDRCHEAKLKFGCQSIFIDHLHYVIDLASGNNMSLEIGYVMRSLKRMAIDLRLPVFIVCHIRSLPLGEEPSMAHLRDSSFVAQESDTVLVVYRRFDKDFFGKSQKTMLQGLATIKVEKARRTGVMRVKIPVRKEGHGIVESLFEAQGKDDE